MSIVRARVDEVGTLIRDGGAFYLRRDLGSRYELELQRTPVDLVEKRVRLATETHMQSLDDVVQLLRFGRSFIAT